MTTFTHETIGSPNNEPTIPRMSTPDLQKLAVAMMENEVFSTWHMRLDWASPSTASDRISAVFLVLALGGLSQFSEKELKKIGMIYEYTSHAMPRTVNGDPSFFSCRFVHVEDLPYLQAAMEHYEQLQRDRDNLMMQGLNQMTEALDLRQEQERSRAINAAFAEMHSEAK